MINLTLKQMRYFEALARQGHFGRAADICAISQPALSMQIKEMEAALGAPLFERSAKKVALTPLGLDMAPRIRDILQAVDGLSDLALAARDRMAGKLRIGVIPTIAPYLLPDVVQRLTRDYPDLDLHVRETLTPRLLQELTEGKLDAALLALPISEPALVETPLFEEDFVLVRPQCDAQDPMPDRDRLREMKLLLLEEGHCFRDQALSFCNLPASAPREVLDGSSLSTLVQMVSVGIGVTLVPELALPVETRSAAVAIGRFDAPCPNRTVGMVWRKSSAITPQLETVADVVRDAAKVRQGLRLL